MPLTEDLSPIAAQAFIEALPIHIREALIQYAAENEFPIEAVLEMAIAFFLDLDSIGFSDCRAQAPGALRERIELLEGVIQRNGLSVPPSILPPEQVEGLLLEGLASGESVEMTQSDWDDLRQVVQTVRADK